MDPVLVLQESVIIVENLVTNHVFAILTMTGADIMIEGICLVIHQDLVAELLTANRRETLLTDAQLAMMPSQEMRTWSKGNRNQ